MNLTLLASIAVLASPAKAAPLPIVEPPAGAGAAVLEASRGVALLEKNDAAGAMPHFDAAWDGGARDGLTAYNAACAESRLGKLDDAMRWLGRAQESGWTDADALAGDDDLVPLHNRADWKPLLDKVRGTHPAKGNEELAAIVADDQADRQHVPTAPAEIQAMLARDRARLARVKELVAAGALHTAEDDFAAALVLQHGDSLDDYAQARALALESARRGRARSLVLAADAWDRWLMKSGAPQRFGTQYRPKPGSPKLFELAPIDPATSDAERAKWGIAPLAELPKTMELR